MLDKSLLYAARKRKLALGQWVMTRNPLILSDTAMTLLRYLVEDRVDDFDHIRTIEQDLMHDIWLLWIFPDLHVERHLDWHVTFNTNLMMMAEMLFISPYEYSHGERRFMNGYDRKCFIEQLEAAYKYAQAAAEFTFAEDR